MLTNSTSEPTTPQEAPPGKVDPAYADVLKLFTVLSRAHGALHDQARKDVARHGLTLGEFGVLEVLYHRGPLLLGEIRERILASSGGITYLVDRLVARNLVERQACPHDRRARYAALTREGVAFMRQIFPEHQRHLAQATEGLSPEERATATRLLRKLGRHAANATPAAPP